MAGMADKRHEAALLVAIPPTLSRAGQVVPGLSAPTGWKGEYSAHHLLCLAFPHVSHPPKLQMTPAALQKAATSARDGIKFLRLSQPEEAPDWKRAVRSMWEIIDPALAWDRDRVQHLDPTRESCPKKLQWGSNCSLCLTPEGV